ncbi:hypothetical protein [Corallococcus exiguus]|uniref:hypothetical protein n=1 Tax=Corallococcus exiguus TaxID=83462 RepID=UPI00156167FD|nr:hypothetical protein [Corallococcus exiguus]NRD43916.1 hypothetical protein [Corallococcus exiguus]
MEQGSGRPKVSWSSAASTGSFPVAPAPRAPVPPSPVPAARAPQAKAPQVTPGSPVRVSWTPYRSPAPGQVPPAGVKDTAQRPFPGVFSLLPFGGTRLPGR